MFQRKVALDAQRVGLGAGLLEQVDLGLGFGRREFRFQFVLSMPQGVGFGVNGLAQARDLGFEGADPRVTLGKQAARPPRLP